MLGYCFVYTPCNGYVLSLHTSQAALLSLFEAQQMMVPSLTSFEYY